MSDERLTVRVALESLKLLESFSMGQGVRTLLVACTDANSYLISAWDNNGALITRLRELLKESGFKTYASDEGRPPSVAVTTNELDTAERAVVMMAQVLNVPINPSPIQRMITRSRTNPG